MDRGSPNVDKETAGKPFQSEPRGVVKGIADADEKARAEAGNKEPVRNTPPAGAWNDVSAD